jgi:hypothetical protein
MFSSFSVHQENMGDDIIGMAVSGMLATDMTPHFTDKIALGLVSYFIHYTNTLS